MTVREEILKLVGKLPEKELYTARRFLEYLSAPLGEDPVLFALENAPVSNETLTDEEEVCLHEAKEDIKAGRVVSHEEFKKRLSL